jgi:hypothetical protein
MTDNYIYQQHQRYCGKDRLKNEDKETAEKHGA